MRQCLATSKFKFFHLTWEWPDFFSWPLSKTLTGIQEHLNIGIINILISTCLQSFMKYLALLIELSYLQGCLLWMRHDKVKMGFIKMMFDMYKTTEKSLYGKGIRLLFALWYFMHRIVFRGEDISSHSHFHLHNSYNLNSSNQLLQNKKINNAK